MKLIIKLKGLVTGRISSHAAILSDQPLRTDLAILVRAASASIRTSLAYFGSHIAVPSNSLVKTVADRPQSHS